MPFTSPAQFALKASNTIGGGDYLVRQPIDYRMIRATRRVRGDGGVVKDGLDAVVLLWDLLEQAEYAVLTGHYVAAQAQGGIYYVRYWDEEASSGAGAFATAKCVPALPDYDRVETNFYRRVEMRLNGLGIA